MDTEYSQRHVINFDSDSGNEEEIVENDHSVTKKRKLDQKSNYVKVSDF